MCSSQVKVVWASRPRSVTVSFSPPLFSDSCSCPLSSFFERFRTWKTCLLIFFIDRVHSFLLHSNTFQHGFDQLEPKDQEIVTVAFKEKKVVKRVKEAEGEASNSASASKEGAGSKKRKSTSKKPRDSKLQSDDDDLEEETSKKVKKGKWRGKGGMKQAWHSCETVKNRVGSLKWENGLSIKRSWMLTESRNEILKSLFYFVPDCRLCESKTWLSNIKIWSSKNFALLITQRWADDDVFTCKEFARARNLSCRFD